MNIHWRKNEWHGGVQGSEARSSPLTTVLWKVLKVEFSLPYGIVSISSRFKHRGLFQDTTMILFCLFSAATLLAGALARQENHTYTNPIISGWNPDPSCVAVDGTFFCTTSSFSAFPGLPVYASKDLINWKLASNALNRPEQVPQLAEYTGNDAEGLWASTLRERGGIFYLITSWVPLDNWQPEILLFQTTDPFDDASWSDPLPIENPANDIDPDLFWDADGTLYMSVAGGIWISELNIETGVVSEPFRSWNGTGGRNPEGPHIYFRDSFYYLLIGEGGTEENHTATLARSENVGGPYESHPGNPVLTNRDTPEYFQTVGHADFFQDLEGNWWGVALATRSGPEWEIYPMGRETVLFPVTWEEGEWPILAPIRGTMAGPLPAENLDIPGDGHWITEPDIVDFEPDSVLPRHFFFWRQPRLSDFTISPEEQPNSLRIKPSFTSLSAPPGFIPQEEGLGFIARKQSATIFNFTVDVTFDPTVVGEEAGVTVFLTHQQHIDLGIVNLATNTSCNATVPHFRFRIEGRGKGGVPVPEPVILPVPRQWRGEPIQLSLLGVSDTEYAFGAAPASRPDEYVQIGAGSTLFVSGGSGPFSGRS